MRYVNDEQLLDIGVPISVEPGWKRCVSQCVRPCPRCFFKENLDTSLHSFDAVVHKCFYGRANFQKHCDWALFLNPPFKLEGRWSIDQVEGNHELHGIDISRCSLPARQRFHHDEFGVSNADHKRVLWRFYRAIVDTRSIRGHVNELFGIASYWHDHRSCSYIICQHDEIEIWRDTQLTDKIKERLLI